ncbi:MAG: ATP-binding protein [Patescibacteria group bacterium]|jgi:signal transduction histidine kinase|nr:ATP-binding protein [Patescibacteria group bacterium]
MYTFYIISTFLTFFSSLFLGLFTYIKGRKKIFNIYWSFVSFSCSSWSLGLWGVVNSDNVKEALLWQSLVDVSAMLIPFLFLLFVIHFVDKHKMLKVVRYLSFSLLVFLVFFSFSEFYKIGVAPTMLFKYWVNPGKFYFLLPLYQFLNVSYALYLLLEDYFKSKGLRKKQLKFIFILSVVGFGGASTNFFPQFLGFYPYGHILVAFYVFLTAYSIFKYRLMDLKFVLRRSSVYLLSFSTVLLLATGLKYIFSQVAPNTDLIDELVIIFVTIIIFPHIREYFSYISNKYFFSSLYNSGEVIARFSEKLSTTLEIDRLLETITSEVNKSFYPKSMSIFLYNEKDSKYYAAFSAGDSFKKRSIFDLNKNVFNKYIDDRNILILSEVKEKSESDYLEIQKTFLNNDIRLIVPLSIKDRYIGLFLIGEKESGETYNNEDVQLLQVLATQSAFALDNSLKFEEAKNFNILLEREVEKSVMELQRANGELRTLDTAKSDFISIASHQLRTPLTVIKGYVSMILEGDFGRLPDIAREPTEKIYDSNERLIKLVEQLLSISRIESGRIKYQFEQTDLSELISGIMEGIRYSAIKKGLDLSYSPPKGFSPIVNIDATKMRQVITSLIDNSIKYTYKSEEKRGFILVRIEDVKDKDRVRLIIEDNGMGIKEEDKINLFKKFSRGKDISTVYTEGTGLGLYVAKKIIEAHNGFIYAESKGRDQGSKIYFDLPKIEKQE